jgi:hypothetical protein
VGQGVSRVLRYTRTRSQRSCRIGEEETVCIPCSVGGDVSGSDEGVDDRACTVPSLLPAYPASLSTSPPSVCHQWRKKGTNGCGALLHMNVMLWLCQGAWSAKGHILRSYRHGTVLL